MAAFAFCGMVFAIQREFGVLVMIEMNGFPVAFGVTSLALFAEASFVLIVLAMARDAGFGSLFVFGVFMAFLAFHLLMLSQEWE